MYKDQIGLKINLINEEVESKEIEIRKLKAKIIELKIEKINLYQQLNP